MTVLPGWGRGPIPGSAISVATGLIGKVELRSFTPTEEDPMTDDRLPLAELLEKAGDGDFLRTVAEACCRS